MQHISTDLLISYTRNECNEEERKQVEEWLRQEDLINEQTDFTNNKILEQEIWQLMQARLLAEKRKHPSLLRRILPPAAAAACIATVAIAAFRFFTYQPKPLIAGIENNQLISYTAPSGKIARLVLPDSSIVHMLGGTEIQYPSRFNKDERILTLQKGEIFLEVRQQANQPFTVHSAGARVMVLGTKFNVQNRPADSIMAVTLTEGSIRFHTTNNRSRILKPGEQLLFNKNTGVIGHISTADINIAAGWIKRKLAFNKHTLPQVLKRLEEYYGIPIIIKSSVDLQQHLTGTFDALDLESTLKMIAFSMHLKFITDKNSITVY